MKRFFALSAAIAVMMGMLVTDVNGQRLVNGGKTSVLLDTATLASVGLNLTSVSGDVLPGDLGNDSVGFAINPRNGSLPTTFSYTAGSLAPFSGTIEHTGSVFFNEPDDTIEVGNFTIGFDGDRVGDNRSGFFVASTVGLAATLFDIENPSGLDAGVDSLTITSNLLVSAELASVLGNTSLTGADVGDALVTATAIPEPTATLMLTGLVGGLLLRRRR
jgi:hypothetical protein